MSKIRIVFVETNAKKNGPIKQTLYIIKFLDRNLFEPYLITIWPEETGNSMLNDYIALGVKTFCCGLSKKASLFLGQKKVTEILETIKPDIVQGVGMPPYRMTLKYKKAVHFITLRNYCYEDYPDQYAKGIGTLLAYMDMQLIKKKLKQGEPIVTCSESLTEMYKKRENLDIPFIRNGIDVEQYKKRKKGEKKELRTKLGLPQDRVIFVYSGGLIDRKNQREAIEAFLKMQNDACLILLGDGKDRDELEKDYGNYKNVIFKGKVDNVRDYLAACDIYLATSKSEGLPNGVLEAMAVGMPVVLSNISQHLEVINIDNRCGMTYQLYDVNELTQKMDEIISDDLESMGECSYELVTQNFLASNMSKKYQEIYKKSLKIQ